MKRAIIGFLLLLPLWTVAQSRVERDQSFYSKKLGREVKYSVYLPDGYGKTAMRYPVLYLLHGFGDDHTTWLDKGRVQTIADSCIRSGEAVPMVIIMPDAEKTWYVDRYDGTVRYETMFFEELIPTVEGRYRVIPEQRAVGGNSMGGYGSMIYALKHGDCFVACAPLSAAFFTDEQMKARHGGMLQEIYGGEPLSDHYRQHSVLDLIPTLKAGQLLPALYFDCGDRDPLSEGNCLAHIALMKRRIAHQFRIRSGAHNWGYWQEALPAVFAFVSEAFRSAGE